MVNVQLSHARRGAEGGQGGSEDAHQHLNDSFPSFFFHVYQEFENLRINPFNPLFEKNSLDL